MAAPESGIRIVVADANRHARGLVCDVLRTAGYRELQQCGEGGELLQAVDQSRPKVVVVAADLPGLPGVAFVKCIRSGFRFVPRETSIILTTAMPTKSMLEAAREVGIDEIIALPFTAKAMAARVRSVVERPRPFVDCVAYVGPCRRRKMLQEYKGPRRRASEPQTAQLPMDWASQDNRTAVRLCIQKISLLGPAVTPAHQMMMRAVYESAMQQATREEQLRNDELGDAARALGVYVSTLPQGTSPDPDTLTKGLARLNALAAQGGPTSAVDEPELALNDQPADAH